jgi:hypothetical protein
VREIEPADRQRTYPSDTSDAQWELIERFSREQAHDTEQILEVVADLRDGALPTSPGGRPRMPGRAMVAIGQRGEFFAAVGGTPIMTSRRPSVSRRSAWRAVRCRPRPASLRPASCAPSWTSSSITGRPLPPDRGRQRHGLLEELG